MLTAWISLSVPRRKAKSSTAAESDSAIPTTAATTPSILPEDFRRPLAVAVRLLAPPKEEAPNRGDDLDYPDPKSPEAVTPMSEDGGLRSPLLGGSKRGSISLVSLISTLPLSGPKELTGLVRAGRSVAVTPSLLTISRTAMRVRAAGRLSLAASSAHTRSRASWTVQA